MLNATIRVLNLGIGATQSGCSMQNTNPPNLFALWRPPLRSFPLLRYSVYWRSTAWLLSPVLFLSRWISLNGRRPIIVFQWFVCRAWFTLMASWLLVCGYSVKNRISSDAHNCVTNHFSTSRQRSSALQNAPHRKLRSLHYSLLSGLAVRKATNPTDTGSTTRSPVLQIMRNLGAGWRNKAKDTALWKLTIMSSLCLRTI